MAIDYEKRRTAQLLAQEVRLYVDEQLRQRGRVRVSEIAAYLQRNASHLNASYKAATGESITSYVQRQKIELAKRLLEETRATLAEIWTELSYYDQSHFTRHFKKVVGVTPQQYRRKSRAMTEALQAN